MNNNYNRLLTIRREIPDNVKLVCVSKFHSNDAIMELYDKGERLFGESRVQELLKKYEELPKDINWHFIGPLQTNKIKYIVPFISLIHSIEKVKQIKEIQKIASGLGKKIDILLEINISEEEQKHGFTESQIISFFRDKEYDNYPNIEICGIMSMATNTENQSIISSEFDSMKRIFDYIKTIYDNPNFKELSMGMSHDYQLAISKGSTLVRVGSKIFGQREY